MLPGDDVEAFYRFEAEIPAGGIINIDHVAENRFEGARLVVDTGAAATMLQIWVAGIAQTALDDRFFLVSTRFRPGFLSALRLTPALPGDCLRLRVKNTSDKAVAFSARLSGMQRLGMVDEVGAARERRIRKQRQEAGKDV